jgi:hypothetical protein
LSNIRDLRLTERQKRQEKVSKIGNKQDNMNWVKWVKSEKIRGNDERGYESKFVHAEKSK